MISRVVRGVSRRLLCAQGNDGASEHPRHAQPGSLLAPTLSGLCRRQLRVSSRTAFQCGILPGTPTLGRPLLGPTALPVHPEGAVSLELRAVGLEAHFLPL